MSADLDKDDDNVSDTGGVKSTEPFKALCDRAAQAIASDALQGISQSESSLSVVLAIVEEARITWPDACVVIGWLAIPALNWRPETSSDIAVLRAFADDGGENPHFYHSWIDLGEGRIFDVFGPTRLSEKERLTSVGDTLASLAYWNEVVSRNHGLLYADILTSQGEIARFWDHLVANRTRHGSSRDSSEPSIRTPGPQLPRASLPYRVLRCVRRSWMGLGAPIRRRRRLIKAWLRSHAPSFPHEDWKRADFVIWRRWERYRDFIRLGKLARRRWATAAESKGDVEYLRKLHAFYVLPGGANGGQEALLIDIFFGQRPYEGYKRKFTDDKGQLRNEIGSHTELGARLLYVRQDNGYVECRLVPARTQLSSRRRPDYFRHPLLLHPRRLRDPSVIKRHLRWLTVYMGHTSLDGAVSLYPWYTPKGLWQRRILLWVLCGWQAVEEGIAKWPLFGRGTFELFKFAATVGLSGVLLWSIDHLRHPAKDTVTPAMQNVENAIQDLSRTEDQDAVETQKIDRRLESIQASLDASRIHLAEIASSFKALHRSPTLPKVKGHSIVSKLSTSNSATSRTSRGADRSGGATPQLDSHSVTTK